MKLPITGSGNGYYGHDAVISYLPDPIDINNVDNNVTENDFSEYLWMEHEEEFDKQVMQELEEEALMEQCIEAMLEDERELLNLHNQVVTAAARGVQQWNSCQRGAEESQPTTFSSLNSSICQAFASLSVADSVANQSTLNPNAQEFVPQQLVGGEKMSELTETKQ